MIPRLAETLRAELAAGDTSSLRAAIADLRLAAAGSVRAEERHAGRRPTRTRKSARPREGGRTLLDPVEDADQAVAPEIDDVPWDDVDG